MAVLLLTIYLLVFFVDVIVAVAVRTAVRRD